LGKRRRDQEGPQKNRRNGPKKIPKVEEGVWKSRVRKDANKKSLGSCDRSQGDVYTTKKEGFIHYLKTKERKSRTLWKTN